MRTSSGGEAEVYMFELTVCSVISLQFCKEGRRGRAGESARVANANVTRGGG